VTAQAPVSSLFQLVYIIV